MANRSSQTIMQIRVEDVRLRVLLEKAARKFIERYHLASGAIRVIKASNLTSAKVYIYRELAGTIHLPQPPFCVGLAWDDESLSSADDELCALVKTDWDAPAVILPVLDGENHQNLPGRAVLGQDDVAFYFLHLVMAPHMRRERAEQPLPRPPRERVDRTIRTKFDGFQAALLFLSVDMVCWRTSVQALLTDEESRRLWDGVVEVQSRSPECRFELLERTAEKYVEARTCETFFSRDVLRLLRGREVRLSYPRALRYILDVVSEQLGNCEERDRFSQTLFDKIPPGVRRAMLAAAELTYCERQTTLESFVAYLESLQGDSPTTVMEWESLSLKQPEVLADLLACHAINIPSTAERLASRIKASPVRVAEQLLFWNGQPEHRFLTEHQKLSILCDSMGSSGVDLLNRMESRIGQLPRLESTPEEKRRVQSELLKRIQTWKWPTTLATSLLKNERTKHTHHCAECGEGFRGPMQLALHQRQHDHKGVWLERRSSSLCPPRVNQDDHQPG